MGNLHVLVKLFNDTGTVVGTRELVGVDFFSLTDNLIGLKNMYYSSSKQLRAVRALVDIAFPEDNN